MVCLWPPPPPPTFFGDSRQQINANPHHTLWNMAVVWSTRKQVVRPNKTVINSLLMHFSVHSFTLLRANVIVSSQCVFCHFQFSITHVLKMWQYFTHGVIFMCVCVCCIVVLFFCFNLNILRKNCNLILQWGSAEISVPLREWKHDDLISSLCLSSTLLPGFYTVEHQRVWRTQSPSQPLTTSIIKVKWFLKMFYKLCIFCSLFTLKLWRVLPVSFLSKLLLYSASSRVSRRSVVC